MTSYRERLAKRTPEVPGWRCWPVLGVIGETWHARMTHTASLGHRVDVYPKDVPEGKDAVSVLKEKIAEYEAANPLAVAENERRMNAPDRAPEAP